MQSFPHGLAASRDTAGESHVRQSNLPCQQQANEVTVRLLRAHLQQVSEDGIGHDRVGVVEHIGRQADFFEHAAEVDTEPGEHLGQVPVRGDTCGARLRKRMLQIHG
jgi:hypothetical protein